MSNPLDSRYESDQDSPGLMLWRVTNRWQAVIRAALKPFRLTHVQFVLLAALAWEPGELTQIELASRTRTDPMMVSQVLRALEVKGLIERREHPADGRARLLNTTGTGAKLAREANAAVEAADAEFFGTESDRPRLLTRLLTELDARNRPEDADRRTLRWVLVTATSKPVRVGLQLQPQHAEYTAIRRTASEAEELGADVVFNWDHFYPLYGEPEGKHFECWTMLGAWAESTTRVQIGALVTCNSYRNPELLADMARTVDHISDGRLILGIGSGWFEKDYDEYGYEFGTAGGRLDDLAMALPRIESRLAKLNPAPTRKIPVLIGGGGEKKTLRLVARHADIWHTFGDPETVERKIAILRQHCADVGRDPADIEISVGVNGSPQELGPRLRALGASLFTVGAGGPGYDLSKLRAWIAWRDSQNS